jgi:amino acid transporter
VAETEVAEPSPANKADKKYYTVRQAAFIGVGAMVGAGIFALLGAAGEVAGAAVWLSFVLASIVTLAGILLLSVALDYGWKRSHPRHPVPVQVSP